MDTETKARAEAALTENVATLAIPELTPPKSEPEEPKPPAPASNRIPSIIVGVVVAAIAGLSIWYLVRPQPLLVQGECRSPRASILPRASTGGLRRFRSYAARRHRRERCWSH